jgi:hypothetical protein
MSFLIDRMFVDVGVLGRVLIDGVKMCVWQIVAEHPSMKSLSCSDVHVLGLKVVVMENVRLECWKGDYSLGQKVD